MPNARRYLTDGLVILIGQGLSRGLGVLLLPLLTLVFLPAQFGMSALATSYISFVSVIALLGLDLTYLQSISGVAKSEADTKTRLIWTLTLCLAVCAALVGSAAWWLWGKQTPESTPWLALGILSTMIFSVCQSELKVARRYLRLACALSIGGIVMYGWVLVRGFSGHYQAVTLVSGYAMGATAACLVSRPSIQFSISQFRFDQAWPIVRIGLPAAISAPMFWIISSMDRWLVAQFWGVSEAGVYAVAASISGIGLLFAGVVQTIWLTEAARLYNSTGNASQVTLAARMKEISFLFALMWLALIAFSGEIVHVFAKPPYDQSLQYLPWLMTSVMLYGLFQALAVNLIIREQYNKSTAVWIVGGVFFVVLSLTLSASSGAVSVAVAQSLTYILMLIWMYVLVRRDAGLSLNAGSAVFLMAAMILAGIIMVATQDLKFNGVHFLLRVVTVIGFGVLVACHFRTQLRNLVAGSKAHG
jgi:O-antigen/teichoic acid export membrane protein